MAYINTPFISIETLNKLKPKIDPYVRTVDELFEQIFFANIAEIESLFIAFQFIDLLLEEGDLRKDFITYIHNPLKVTVIPVKFIFIAPFYFADLYEKRKELTTIKYHFLEKTPRPFKLNVNKDDIYYGGLYRVSLSITMLCSLVVQLNFDDFMSGVVSGGHYEAFNIISRFILKVDNIENYSKKITKNDISTSLIKYLLKANIVSKENLFFELTKNISLSIENIVYIIENAKDQAHQIFMKIYQSSMNKHIFYSKTIILTALRYNMDIFEEIVKWGTYITPTLEDALSVINTQDYNGIKNYMRITKLCDSNIGEITNPAIQELLRSFL